LDGKAIVLETLTKRFMVKTKALKFMLKFWYNQKISAGSVRV
jgi:hypothetical protein